MVLHCLLALTFSLFALVAAQDGVHIVVPGGPNLWWINKSLNVYTWNCQTNALFPNFTVLLVKKPGVPLAIQAVEYNFVCSRSVPDINVIPGDGYTLQFANALNSSDVYTESLPFEIKELGAQYPAASATPTDTATVATISPSTAPIRSKNTGTVSSPPGMLVVVLLASAAAVLII